MSDRNNAREELERRIAERLARLDDDSLLRLDAISEHAELRSREVPLPIAGASQAATLERGMNRRGFLVGAGGVVLLGTAAVGGLIGSALANADTLKMRALIALYEELEKTGLDALVVAGIAAVSAALDVAKTLGGALSAGIRLVDGALLGFERLFPLVRQGLALVQGAISGLAKLVADVEQKLAEVTGIAKPVTDAVSKFFSDLLDKIPFGVGANVKTLINNLIVLVASVPMFIESLNTNLVTPLKQDWFTDDETKSLKGGLFEPLRKNVLQPADALVTQLSKTSDEWSKNIAPINQALAQRASIRQQIAEVQAGKQLRGTAAP